MSEKRIPRALTIAGSDSGGGAGLQADLKTFAAWGVHGMTAVTAVTAQNSRTVAAVFELPPDFVAQQIDAVIEDFGADAVKTGMVANAAILRSVAARLKAHRLERLVVDPVMSAAGGGRLIQPEAIPDLTSYLIPLALVVTPNLPEACILADMDIPDLKAMEEAARRIHRLGCRAVLLKGGHWPGDTAIDLFYDGVTTETLTAPRVATENVHGTGCTLSAAIAAGLARGHDLVTSVRQAKEYVTGALKRSYRLGIGPGPLGHFPTMTNAR